jgi:hypothetical protein
MCRVGFSDLKIKVMGDTSWISAVDLVKAFANVDDFGRQRLSPDCRHSRQARRLWRAICSDWSDHR